MMRYMDMVAKARKEGKANESNMWASIRMVDDLLDEIDNEVLKQKFMRDAHEMFYGMHYTTEIAAEDLSGMKYTDREGVKRTGAHWTLEEVKVAWEGIKFPADTTDADKWVAANVFYADLCQVLDDATILKAAHKFWFEDEDAHEGKIWVYMRDMKSC